MRRDGNPSFPNSPLQENRMMHLPAIHIYPYGLAVATAAALCLALTGRAMAHRSLMRDTLTTFALWGIPLCFLCARLLYCLICLDGFSRDGIAYFFSFTQGGYTLWGAVFGGALAIGIAARKTGQDARAIADALAAPAALMVALCRLAEGLVGQGYGWYVEDWFDPSSGMSLFHPQELDAFLRFPFAVQDMYGEWCFAIFMLEALFALMIFFLLRRAASHAPGETAQTFLLLLASSQILFESLRQDAVLRFGFVRINQVLSAVVVVSLLACGCLRLAANGRKAPILPAVLGTALCIGVAIAMEFALEKKIVLLEWMPMDVCYAMTALACIGLAAIVRTVLKTGVRIPSRGAH